MRLAPLLALLLTLSSPAGAQEGRPAGGPVLGELLQRPAFFRAWQALIGSETVPAWVTEYTATLDGPPTPSIPVVIGKETYLLAFTCKPNECESFQLFVLFAPDGRKAWALMGSPLHGVGWLGQPDEHIRAAITGALKR